jgi:flagellar motility protein MotE (MotC chaperone)
MFDYNQMLSQYASVGQYSAKAEKEAAQAAKNAQQAKQIPSTGCGNHSCRICYNVVQRVANAVRPQEKTREQIMKETLDDLHKMRAEGDEMERKLTSFENEFAALRCELRNKSHVHLIC